MAIGIETKKPEAEVVDIYEVQQKSQEQLEYEKRSKWTKQAFTMYNVEYIFQTIIVWFLFAWFVLHMVFLCMTLNGADYEFLDIYYNFMEKDLWGGVIVGNYVFASWWSKAIFAILFFPLVYLEYRKTIATHKDYYRICWHILFTRNAVVNYVFLSVGWFLSGLIYGARIHNMFDGYTPNWPVDYTYSGWNTTYQYLVWPFVHMFLWTFHDIFKYVIPIFYPGVYINFISDDAQTQFYYEFMKVACCGAYGAGVDLGFNLYDSYMPTEDYSRTPKEAQLAKFNYAFEKIGIKSGMRVIDVGCGMGDWLYWLKTEKGCKVIGLNITMGHADVVEDRGIPCLRGSWQSFYQKVLDGNSEFINLYGGKFDAVTCWDTIEHYVKGKDVWNKKVIAETYRKLFKLAFFFLDKNSECGGFWSSTLHQSRRLSTKWYTYTFWKEWINCYLMNLTYNGMYPTDITGGSVCKGLKERAGPQFSLSFEEDKIEDYRMTSILCMNHFGNFTMDWNLRLIYTCFVQLFANSHFLPVFFNAAFRVENAWMWHVGGIKKDIAPDCPTKLLWQVFKFNPTADPDEDAPDDDNIKADELGPVMQAAESENNSRV